MTSPMKVTCCVRYVLSPGKTAEFEHYARWWMRLIEKHGGTHLGFFMPERTPPSAAFSFAGIGTEGPDNVAMALFSFTISPRTTRTGPRRVMSSRL
jgi:NIPSNAP